MLAGRVELARSRLERGVSALTVLLVFGLVALTLGQVVMRYVFNAPLRWSEELARYTFVWISFLSVYLTYRQGAHLSLDILPGRLPAASRALLGACVELILFGTVAWAIITTGPLIRISMVQGSAVLGIPMVIVYAAVVVSFALIAADLVAGWVKRVAVQSRERTTP